MLQTRDLQSDIEAAVMKYRDEVRILDIAIQMVGDNHIENVMTVPFLDFLLHRGYVFASEMEKLKITKMSI